MSYPNEQPPHPQQHGQPQPNSQPQHSPGQQYAPPQSVAQGEQPYPQHQPHQPQAPQYAQPQQAPHYPVSPQYAQPQQTPHYAQAPQPAPHYAQRPATPAGALNVLGVIALLCMVADALFSFVIPFMLRAASVDFNMMLFSLATGGVRWTLIVLATVFGLIGLAQKQRTRGRWTVYAALGAAGCAAISSLASILGGIAMSGSYLY